MVELLEVQKHLFEFGENATGLFSEKEPLGLSAFPLDDASASGWRCAGERIGFGQFRLTLFEAQDCALLPPRGRAFITLIRVSHGRVVARQPDGKPVLLGSNWTFLPLAEIRIESHGHADWILMEISRAQVEKSLALYDKRLDLSTVMSCSAFKPNFPGIGQIEILATAALKVTQDDLGDGGYPSAYISAIDDLISLRVAHALKHFPSGSNVTSTRGMQIGLQKCLDFIHANFRQKLEVSEIAAIAGIGVRSLQLAFRKNVNMTISEYIQRVRLDYAHEQLARPGSCQTVEDVALGAGFKHAGYFAEVFRRNFGELPSDVQRRVRRRMAQYAAIQR